ncbi:MAG: hypothetical protein KAJ72_08965, partial [Candidatus Heimdallarchaeota archaeon]|nr:hypothetical protein [Candidatus Heimdallarchaeota archaeon]
MVREYISDKLNPILNYYYFFSEITVLLSLISMYSWIIVMYQPPNSVMDLLILRRLPSVISILLIILGFVYILNNFVYVFSIKPTQRMFASLIRIVSISLISIFAIICMNRVTWEFKYYFIFSFALYACYSFTMLRVFLLSVKNKTSNVFFQHLSLEKEQKTNQTKSDFISGILALV